MRTDPALDRKEFLLSNQEMAKELQRVYLSGGLHSCICPQLLRGMP